MGFYTDRVVPLTRSVRDRLCSDELPYTARNNACMDKMNCCKTFALKKETWFLLLRSNSFTWYDF